MAVLVWDQSGQRRYETGVDRGVLYIPDGAGAYSNGYAWNGLVSVTESPSGAEASPQYADNIKYLNLVSAEDFSGTIEAFYSPKEFDQCDGSATPYAGVSVGQQSRKTFGLSYRNLIGNDLVGTDFGEKIHLVYGALAGPSEKTRATVNDSPEAVTFSWEFTTTPVDVPGLKPSAHITIDSTQVAAAGLTALKNALYGTAGTNPRLPLPAEVFGFFAGTVTTINTLNKPANTGNVITIPTTTGIAYQVNGTTIPAGSYTITKNTILTAVALPGYQINPDLDTDWGYTFT